MRTRPIPPRPIRPLSARFDPLWIGACLLSGCSQHQRFDDPLFDDGTFERAEPSPEEIAGFEAAAAYSERENGRALMVLRGDEVIFEDYENDVGAEEPTEIYSGTKSFSCATAMLAIEDGFLDLDEPAADTLTEWQDNRGDIKVRQLLQFTSGLKEAYWRLTYDGLIVNQRVEDKYQVAVDQPLHSAPGSTFEYNGTHLLAFGELIKRKLDRDPVDYLTERVFDPIGMRFSGWNRDPDGNAMLAFGAWTTANEWLKYGVLVRDDGLWQGEQVMAPGAFSACFSGSKQMPAYGLNWWLNAEITDEQAKLVPAAGVVGGRLFPSAPADTVTAAGAMDSRLYIIPSLDLVIVRMGGGSLGWKDDEFLAEILAGE